MHRSLFPRRDFVNNKYNQEERHDDQEKEEGQEHQPSLEIEISPMQNRHERRGENRHLLWSLCELTKQGREPKQIGQDVVRNSFEQFAKQDPAPASLTQE